ncbi:MAG: efflux RND transporter permease subunit [Sphingomonadales bacterium]|nr:efflux RND transporter permease subunit [Sphingomonadales bacterium]
MNISRIFIARPVATALLAIAVLLIGTVAYLSLPVAPLPNVDFPTVQVNAALPGASAVTMASNVATPLERQFSAIPGITQMTSSSSLGTTGITLQFQLNQTMESDFQQVQAAINAASAQLPSNLPAQPTIRRVNPSDAPIMVLTMSSDTLPLDQVDNYADIIFSQQVSRIQGVGLVTIGGEQKPAVRIRLDPRKIAARGLQYDNVRAAIVAQTTNQPKGAFTGPKQALTVYANDQILDAQGWKNLIVGYSKGAPIRISDIGDAVQSVENDQIMAYAAPGRGNADPAFKPGQTILLVVFKQPGANVIDTVRMIKAALPQMERSIPPGITVHILRDGTQTIQASVFDVEKTLLITMALVVIVIFLFLLDLRATLIPSAVIPLALLGATGFLYLAGDTLDNLSLMALSIAVGFVVDDAIVMVEVIWKHLERGEKPLAAALAGSGEVGFTVLAISISLIAVFTPLMFMSGIVGLLMREFAVALSAAVIMSVILSLSFTAMLCGQFLKPPHPHRHRIVQALDRGFHRLEKSYERGLDRVMRHRLATLIVFLVSLSLAIGMYATARTGFFPQQDTGFLGGVLLTSQDASIAKMREKIEAVTQVIDSDPAVAGTGVFVGINSTSQAMLFIQLKPRDERSADADQIIARLRPRLERVVGAQTFLQSRQDINIGGRLGQAQYQYTLSDSSLDELNAWAPRLLAAMQKLPELKDVSSDQRSKGGALNLTIDRDAAARFGITPTAIDNAIYGMIGQDEVTQYFTQQNSYHLVVEALPELQADPGLLNWIYLLSPITGKTVPLSLFVHATPGTNLVTVNHQGEYPAATLSFNLAPGTSLSEATAAITKQQSDLGAPPTLTGSFQGNAQAFQESLSSEPVLILAALIAVYVILGVLYESFIHPLTILSTLPSAGVGALLALRFAGFDLNVIGIIAIILLIGIVKKNGIMIVDVAMRLEREEALSAEEAATRASIERFRPILMTTACAMLGGLPMILMGGTGSEFRRPLGYAIVGGLAVSQVLTLFTTPVIYTYLDRLRRRPRDEGEGRARSKPAPAPI